MPAPRAPRPDLAPMIDALCRVLSLTERDLLYAVSNSRFTSRVRHLAWWLLLGVAAEKGTPVTIRQLAGVSHTSERYMSTVLRSLRPYPGGRATAGLIRRYKLALKGERVMPIALEVMAMRDLLDAVNNPDAPPRVQKRTWVRAQRARA